MTKRHKVVKKYKFVKKYDKKSQNSEIKQKIMWKLPSQAKSLRKSLVFT